MPLKIALAGAGGRMGLTLARLIAEDPTFELVAALDRPDSQALGEDLGQLAGLGRPLNLGLSADPDAALGSAQVLVDFSLPEASLSLAAAVQRHKTAWVLGTTGHDASVRGAIDAAAHTVPLLWAANYSVGVTLLRHLTEQAAQALGEGWDIEVLEMHHRKKVDAPSGTALALGEAAAKGRGWDLEQVQRLSREGQTGARPDAEIGFATLRGGDVAGEHALIFASEGERLELHHRATNRTIFAQGALRGARWLVAQAPGRYDMPDVLGLS